MRAGVNNRGILRFSWIITEACARNETARFDATNVKTGLATTDHERIEMAPTIYSRQGRTPAIGTDHERGAFHMGGRNV